MANPLDLDQPSAFESVLKYLGRGGYAARNLLKGNVEGAVRQTADILGDTADAFLPGDLVSEFSRPDQDYTEASDLVGGMEPGLLKTGVDILGGIATDPLTYTGLGLFTKPLSAGLSAARTGVAQLPKGAEALAALDKGAANAGPYFREMAGASRVDPKWASPLEAGDKAQSLATAVNYGSGGKALSNLLPGDEDLFGQAIQGVRKGDNGYEAILPSVPNTPRAQLTDAVNERLAPMAQEEPLSAAEAYLQTKAPGKSRGPLDSVDKLLGIRGVTDAVDADAAAARTLEQAYPKLPTDPLFSNGADVAANDLLGRPSMEGVKRMAGDRLLGPTPEEAAKILPMADKYATLSNIVPQTGAKADSLSSMLGATDIPNISRQGMDLIKNPGEASMFTSGMSKTVPEMEHVAPENLSRALFTNRGPLDELTKTVSDRIDALGLDPQQAQRLKDAVPEYLSTKQNQFKELVEKGVLSVPQGSDLTKEGAIYMTRLFSGGKFDDAMKLGGVEGSAANIANARKLNTPEEVAQFLNNNPDVNLETNAAKAEGIYAQRHAQQMGKAAFAQDLVGKVAKTADDKMAEAAKNTEKWTMLPQEEKYAAAGLKPEEVAAYEAKGSSLYSLDGGTKLKSAVPQIIESIAREGDPETARALNVFWSGLPPREGMWKALAKVNSMFKPFATAGAFLPRINFTVRNITTGGLFQVLAEPAARAQWPKYAREAAGMLTGAIDDGIERLSGGRVGSDQFRAMSDAIANSGGSADRAINALPEGPMREALRYGVVTDGFADTELIAKEIANKGWSKKYSDIRDWPAAIAQGSEKRMRYSVFEGLMNDGVSPEEAAKIVKQTFYDYKITSQSNRAARDVIPFFQFTAKAVPQALKLMKEKPFIIPAVRPLYTSDDSNDSPLPGYLQKSINIPLGEGANGNPNYLTSLGLPLEVLGQIPNPSGSLHDFGRDLRQDVVGSANPALKTLYSLISGTDPYMGTKWGSYDKAPDIAQALGADPHSHLAANYNMLAGTGVIQPLSSPVSLLSSLFSDKMDAGGTALNALTGAKIQNVDQDAALRQLLSDKLSGNPDVSSYESLYQKSPDPQTQAMLAELHQIQKRMREKKKSAMLP